MDELVKPLKRRAVLTGLASGAALHLPLPGLLHAQMNDTTDLIWQSDAARVADTSAYNRSTAKIPAHRALCMTEAGVAQALRWARESDTPFTVQSGGHCFAGLSQSDQLVIDLRHLDQVAMTSATTLDAKPGATLGDVNLATAPTAQALPAGYCQNVGIDGHVGGGGLGVLSRQFGLACDHLMAARVLLANGVFVTASAEENPDLFWALRGGGSGSFGIVTNFTFRLQHVPTATFAESVWILDHTRAGQFLSDWQRLNQTLNAGISCYLYLKNHTLGRTHIRVRLVATSSEGTTNDSIAGLHALAPSLTEPYLLQGSFDTIAEQVWPRSYNPKTRSQIASNYLRDAAAPEDWAHVLERFEAHASYQPTMVIESLGGAIDDVPPAGTAYFHRRGPKFLVQMQVADQPNNNMAATDAALRSLQAALAPATIPGAYINYPDVGLANWDTQYWGTNLARLRRTKKSYDPENVFLHALSIKP